MRRILWMTLIVSFLFTAQLSMASRVAEVEDYFHSRTHSFLQSRFPDKPFSIMVSVETGRVEPTRKEFRLMKDSGVDLPLWYESDEENVNLWDRPDVSLGRLIKETKKVKIDIKVDATLSDEEVAELQAALASQLKLDPDSDSIVVKKMSWANQERYRNLKWVGGTFAIIMATLFFAFWILTRLHVSRLIQGLSQPIKEIGQSTKKFASNALNMGQPAALPRSKSPDSDSEQSSGSDLANGSTMMELRKSCLILIEKSKEMFKTPDPYMMSFIEKEGERHPGAMGAILAELEEGDLKELYRHGVGHWWFKAIAQPTPLNAHSLEILARLERLRMRKHFSHHETGGKEAGDKMRNLGLYLCRMNSEEIAKALEGLPIEKAGYILNQLPTSLELGTAKILFPGQWAVFLDADSSFANPESKVLDFVLERAKSILPPRNEKDIKNFFEDLDLADYLDTADPRDEKDLYRALHEGSRIRQERTPFYEILESQESFLPLLGSEMTLDEWVHALNNVQLSDREFFIKQLPEKLGYQIKNRYKEIDPADISDSQMREARRRLTRVYNELYFQKQREIIDKDLLDSIENTNDKDTDSELGDQQNEDETAA